MKRTQRILTVVLISLASGLSICHSQSEWQPTTVANILKNLKPYHMAKTEVVGKYSIGFESSSFSDGSKCSKEHQRFCSLSVAASPRCIARRSDQSRSIPCSDFIEGLVRASNTSSTPSVSQRAPVALENVTLRGVIHTEPAGITYGRGVSRNSLGGFGHLRAWFAEIEVVEIIIPRDSPLLQE